MNVIPVIVAGQTQAATHIARGDVIRTIEASDVAAVKQALIDRQLFLGIKQHSTKARVGAIGGHRFNASGAPISTCLLVGFEDILAAEEAFAEIRIGEDKYGYRDVMPIDGIPGL